MSHLNSRVGCYKTNILAIIAVTLIFSACSGNSKGQNHGLGTTKILTFPSPNRALITLQASSAVVPVDLDNMSVQAPIDLASAPLAIAKSPENNLILVGEYGTASQVPLPHQVAEISWPSLNLREPINTSEQPAAISFIHGGKIALVATDASEKLDEIDIKTGTVERSISTGAHAHALVTSQNGSIAFLANFGAYMGKPGNSVIPVNLENFKVGRPIKVGTEPCDEAVTPNGKQVLVTVEGNNATTGYVVAIDVATLKAGKPIPIGPMPSGITIDPNGKTAWVALDPPDISHDAIVPLDLSNGKVGTPIPVGDEPWKIAITANGSTAYVVDAGSGELVKVDLESRKVVDSVEVGPQPHGIVLLAK